MQSKAPKTWKFVIGFLGVIPFVWWHFRFNKEISESYYLELKNIYIGVEGLNLTAFDGSDLQYVKFHCNMIPLGLYFIIIMMGTKKIWERISGINKLKQKSLHVSEENTKACFVNHSVVQQKILYLYSLFYTVHGIGFVLAIHWFTSFYLFAILLLFHSISLFKGSKMNPILTWSLGMFVLFSSDIFKGYQLFEWMLGEEHWLAVLIDEYRGSLPWHVYYRMSMLRVISYNLDKYWAYRDADTFKTTSEYTKRVVTHIPLDNYGFLQFFAYVLYPPLYIAGPIITFNNFMSQLASPIKGNTLRERLTVGAWTLFLIAMFDMVLHYNCVHAISVSYVWEDWEEAWQVAFVGLWTLQFMYMKFLIFWRFFRMFSLFDNIVPPDNMPHCIASSNTFADFWRAWHASFNRWTIRYLYGPLGGAKNLKYSVWLIFMFVGLWHDLWLSWVAWALMNGLFFTIEILVTLEYKKEKYNKLRDLPGWRIIELLVTGANGILILCSNISLVYGPDHMPQFLKLVFFSSTSWKLYLSLGVFSLFCCTLQDEVQKREKLACPFTHKKESNKKE